MKIGIVGTGKMGRGFAEALSDTHDVTVGSRDPNALAPSPLEPARRVAPPTPRRPRTPTS